MHMTNRRVVGVATILTISLLPGIRSESRADVGPPVKIGMVPTDGPAVNGMEYRGEFTIDVRESGTLSEVTIRGKGWTVLGFDAPSEPQDVEPGTLFVPFRAIPTDADARITLALRYDGRHVSRSVAVGPAVFARRRYGNATRQVSSVSSPSGRQVTPISSETSIDAPTPLAAQGCRSLRFEGRIVYERPSAIDDTCQMPTAFTLEGVDGIKVEIVDEDDIVDEVIWTGYTRPDGTFDSGTISWDDCDIGCSVGCDDPDLYLRYECDTGVVNVQDGDDILEGDWTWDSSDHVINDFTGTYMNFGTHMPANSAQMPALHIHNSITRAHRFLVDRGIADLPEVDVLWPWGDNAFYDKYEPEINVSVRRQWNESTHVHEYGHHFMENESYSNTPSYCNGFCDGEESCTSGTDCENEGHCSGCPENAEDAWNEGFPNWMADVIIRSWAEDYTLSDGSPWEAQPACGRSQELPKSCCQDDMMHNGTDAWITETFVGVLLRDMEDGVSIQGEGLQDDHNGDGIADSLCLGVDEIFGIVTGPAPPTNLEEFVNQFYGLYPEHRAAFWRTAVNVDPVFVNSLYPSDILAPEGVVIVESPTHPLGVGGTSSCVLIEWEPPADDVTGACAYSYAWSTDAAGAVPDMSANIVDFSGCRPAAHLEHYGLGTYYFGIRAQDCAGHWGPHQVFGPFEITECNGNGILDVCDISCDGSELDFTGTCVAGMSPDTCDVPGCGTEEDCNGNLVPDGCDIVDGFSEDCNIDGVPDECQPVKHWMGGLDSDWGNAGNWVEGVIPGYGDYVCIPADAAGAPVVYQEDDTLLASLSSRSDFTMDHGVPSVTPDLRLVINSFVLGDFQMTGGSNRLTVDERFYVDGRFIWDDGQINGPGVTEVNNGLDLTRYSGNLVGGELKLIGGQSVANGARIVLNSGARLTIGPPATYTYTGNSVIFEGGSGLVDVRGTLNSVATQDSVSVYAPVDNSGTIRAQVGELTLNYGGTHSGNLLGDTGASISLSRTHELTETSNVAVEALELASSNGGNIHGTMNISDTLTCSSGVWTIHPDATIVDYGRHLIATAGTHKFFAPTDAPVDFDTVTIGRPAEGGLSVYFDTGQPINTASLRIDGGAVYGSSPINISGTFTWVSLGFRAGGDVTAHGPVVMGGGSRFLDRSFYNTQATTQSGGVLEMGGPAGVRWYNLPGSMYEITGNTANISGRTFQNDATILRSAGTGLVTIGSRVENAGLVHNQTGTMGLTGGGVHSGEVRSDPGTLLRFGLETEFLPGSTLIADDVDLGGHGGAVRGTVDIAGTLEVTGAPWTFTNEANIIGYGTDLIVNPGSILFEAPTDTPMTFDTVTFKAGEGGSQANFNTGQTVNIGTLTLVNATVMGASPIDVTDSFIWTTGNLFPGGALTLHGTSVVNPTSSARTASRHILNAGHFTLLGGFGLSSGRRLHNLDTGVFDIQGDATRIGAGTFQNDGLLLKSTAVGTALFQNTDLLNAGTIEIQVGDLRVEAADFVQTGGQTVLNGGNLAVTNSFNPATISGGSLKGSGTVFGDVVNDGGVIEPGLSAGALAIDGDYVQGPGATLDIEIGGTTPGAFDVLTVNGTATLAGELHVVNIDAFVPLMGETFVILSAANVVGAFDTEAVPLQYEVVYGPTEVSLRAGAPSPDLNGDGTVDLADYALFQSCYGGADQVPGADCPAGANADLDADGDVDLDDFDLLLSGMLP